MVSIMARPTNSVRDRVPAASGWRAIASIAAATARPSPSAGPIAPNATAIAAARMESCSTVMGSPPLDAADAGAAEHRREHREDVGLDQTDQNLERHQR